MTTSIIDSLFKYCRRIWFSSCDKKHQNYTGSLPPKSCFALGTTYSASVWKLVHTYARMCAKWSERSFEYAKQIILA